LYFEMLEILSAAQNDLPFQGQKHLRSRCFIRSIYGANSSKVKFKQYE